MARKVKKINSFDGGHKKKRKSYSEEKSQFSYVLLFALGLFLFFLVVIKGEHLWKSMHNLVFGLFGFFSFFIGILIMALAILFSSNVLKKSSKLKFYQFISLFILLCAQVQIYSFEEIAGVNLFKSLKRAWSYGVLDSFGGGVVGELFSIIFRSFLGKKAAIIFVWILIFVLTLGVTSATLFGFFKVIFAPVKKVEKSLKNFKFSSRFDIDVPIEDGEDAKKEKVPESLDVSDNLNFFKNKKELQDVKKLDEQKVIDRQIPIVEKKEKSVAEKADKNCDVFANSDEKIEKGEKEEKERKDVNKLVEAKEKLEDLVKRASNEFSEKVIKDVDDDFNSGEKLNGYCFPPISLLNSPKSSENLDVSNELRANAATLVDTLRSFGVETRITDICRGPSVTRYELQPCAGVKISKITNLADDISLNLAAGGVRIEAPVPNKAVVGIEVPNKEKEMVYLKEVISSEEFVAAKSSLTFALGKDIAGNVKLADIAKMPHILIAGATGSGKSVCVNSLIVSLLYKSSPSDVRLLMIDPKVVELGVYNGIPHLLVPVVTEPKKASGALSWAVTEMMHRYKLFAKTGVREMKSFNMLVESGRRNEEGQLYEKLPQIVIIIDELADLMMASMSREVENSICRLAQMARAAGMHLVIATQRPSVDVITGLIKANIPSRIAFTVSSQVDSRTIIDVAGAEKLLGKGDMLYYPIDEQKPVRVQGCFLSDGEIEKIVDFIKQDKNCNYSEDIIEEIDRYSAKNEKKPSGSDSNFDEKDPMLFAAIETVVENKQASTSFLQRKLKLGYSRAARIMDELEMMKVVGPQTGSKPREILMTREEFLQLSLNERK